MKHYLVRVKTESKKVYFQLIHDERPRPARKGTLHAPVLLREFGDEADGLSLDEVVYLWIIGRGTAPDLPRVSVPRVRATALTAPELMGQ
jgi:hypothetical protein